MTWKKLGLVFCPDGSNAGMASHASTPAVEVLGGNRVRVFFTARDRENRSSIFELELEIGGESARVLRVGDEAVLSPGAAGLFDDSGVSMGCLAGANGGTYLYYVGWNLGVTVPWRNSIGLAIRRPGERAFEKYSPAPLLDRNRVDPYSLSYPWVIREKDGGWKMWYGSNLSWGAGKEDMVHAIKQCTSRDGLHWERKGDQALELAGAGEDSMARPCVVCDRDCYRMWYSRRGDSYRIGYAESADGWSWERKDDLAGITVSAEGWDAESVEYPCAFDLNGKRYLLYNGNSYGKTGFGLAVAAEES